MKNYDELIDIRSIQQYLYCPHRWGLIEIDCSFIENVFVTKGNMVHERVNSGDIFSARGVIHENTVRVYNDEFGVYGVLDCLEFKKNKNGIYVEKYKDCFNVSIVEYKVTAPKDGKTRYEDNMQVLAQKICVDNLFDCDCSCYFYYANTKKRQEIEFLNNDYEELKNILKEMKNLKQTFTIPNIRENQNCSGCSLKDICLPPKKGRKK